MKTHIEGLNNVGTGEAEMNSRTTYDMNSKGLFKGNLVRIMDKQDKNFNKLAIVLQTKRGDVLTQVINSEENPRWILGINLKRVLTNTNIERYI